MKFIVCEACGAHLDFGERCDCKKELDNKSILIFESNTPEGVALDNAPEK